MMHFEILVEDLSGKIALEVLVPKLIGDDDTCRVIPYKGVGRIPRNLRATADPSKRVLLDRLPRLLRGYGRAFGADYPAVVVVVCDLDSKCLKRFRAELDAVLESCNPQPTTRFCVAVEEGEAWLLGDRSAVKAAFPLAKTAVLDSYEHDSICGTWEKLADAVHPGGSTKLSNGGWQAIGKAKSEWAARITPFMQPDNNGSPSFLYFRAKLRELAEI